jgi:dTDP-4-amino-4,6-dideoxygalactose transaminase
MKHAMLCNSGSSANLLAVTALTSSRLGKRALKEGDEVQILPSSDGFAVTKDESKTKALETIASFKGRLNKDFKFNRDEANER